MRIIIFLSAITVFLQACSSQASEKNKVINKEVVPVKLLEINSDTNNNSILASGTLSTEDEARLSFKIGGIVENIMVTEGDKVRKGQLLATLKSTEIAAQVQQVRLALEKAERDYQRAYNLYQDSVATLEQVQNAKTGLEIAKQNLQQVSFNSDYSRIVSPVDGFVTKKIANAGEYTSAGSSIILLSASSANSKWVLKAGLSDHDWAATDLNNKASITVDAFPGKTFAGRISKKALAADPVSGSFNIELEVAFGKEQPAVGMFGTARIQSGKKSIGYRIPYEALLEANGKKGFVFVSDDGKSVKKVTVLISSIDNNTAYISEGLQGYRYVVSSGSPYLSESSAIAVVK